MILWIFIIYDIGECLGFDSFKIHYTLWYTTQKKKGKWHMIVDRIYELTTMFMGFVIWNFDFSFSLSLLSLCIYIFFWFIFCYVKNIKLHNTIWYTIQTHARTCVRTHTHNTIYKLTATFLGFNYLKFWAPPFSLSLSLSASAVEFFHFPAHLRTLAIFSMFLSLLLYQLSLSIYLTAGAWIFSFCLHIWGHQQPCPCIDAEGSNEHGHISCHGWID